MNQAMIAILKKIFYICFYFLLVTTTSYALPFNIIPAVPLPTSIYSNTIAAYYTVINNTQSQRNNNFVKYLPPNVSQVTSDGTYPNTCGTTFNLSAHGQAGDSCILQLSISGSVNSNDPDPTHHLFVCLSGGTSCAGTSYPLNISQPGLVALTVTPAKTTINALATQQFTAAGTYSDGTTQNITTGITWVSVPSIASMIDTGLATGVSTGSSSITATIGAITGSATLDVVSFAYLVNAGQNTVFSCSIYSSGALNTCTQVINTFTNPYVIALTPSGTYAYIGAQNGAAITYCTTSGCSINGTLCGCTSAAGTPNSVAEMAINTSSSYLYLTTGNEIQYCQIGSNGSLSTCNTTGSTVNSASGIVLNPANTIVYAASQSNGTIYSCSVNSSDNSLNACTTFYSGLSSPVALAMNYNGSYLYITNGSSTLTYCAVNSDGSAGTCNTTTAAGLTAVKGIAFNGPGSLVYLTNGNDILYCSINYDGTLNTCNDTGTFTSPFGVTIS